MKQCRKPRFPWSQELDGEMYNVGLLDTGDCEDNLRYSGSVCLSSVFDDWLRSFPRRVNKDAIILFLDMERNMQLNGILYGIDIRSKHRVVDDVQAALNELERLGAIWHYKRYHHNGSRHWNPSIAVLRDCITKGRLCT